MWPHGQKLAAHISSLYKLDALSFKTKNRLGGRSQRSCALKLVILSLSALGTRSIGDDRLIR